MRDGEFPISKSGVLASQIVLRERSERKNVGFYMNEASKSMEGFNTSEASEENVGFYMRKASKNMDGFYASEVSEKCGVFL